MPAIFRSESNCQPTLLVGAQMRLSLGSTDGAVGKAPRRSGKPMDTNNNPGAAVGGEPGSGQNENLQGSAAAPLKIPAQYTRKPRRCVPCNSKRVVHIGHMYLRTDPPVRAGYGLCRTCAELILDGGQEAEYMLEQIYEQGVSVFNEHVLPKMRAKGTG